MVQVTALRSGTPAARFTHGIGLPHLVEAGDPALVDKVGRRPVPAGEKIGPETTFRAHSGDA